RWVQVGEMGGGGGGGGGGGEGGSAIAQGSQFGLGTLLLRYSRDYEKQADLLGAQIMARAGYDPRALAHMFETIEKESKGSGGTPQWMNSHPNPGNRTVHVARNRGTLRMASAADTSQFQPIKMAFKAMPPGKSMADVERGNAAGGGGGGETARSVGTPGQPVPRPSSQFREISGGKVFQASVPDNWTALPAKSSIKVVPQNGYGDMNGQTVFSHGVEFGISKASSRDLQEATNAWLQAGAQNNPELRPPGQQRRVRISQRSAIQTPLVNPSPLGGQGHVVVYTTFLSDGTLFYYFTVVPAKDAAAFQDAFRHITESIKLTEVR